jgi:Phosphotyrosine interaction domain (PTB/PID)
MRLKVCPSGLKATTRQHGLTEYWSHRITFCLAPKSYPKIFCWIYRHEGRKLKHELRCHAVICSKEAVCLEITTNLKVRSIFFSNMTTKLSHGVRVFTTA